VGGVARGAHPWDLRPRQAIEHARAWVRGEVRMMQARAAGGGHAIGAARNLRGAPRHAAYAAGAAAHELRAAAVLFVTSARPGGAALASAEAGDGPQRRTKSDQAARFRLTR
jgi:hypothetical protein